MKKSYLLKIIKEEITNVLAEDANADKAARDAQKAALQKQILALQKRLADLAKGGNMNENELEEDQLNEMAKIAGDLEMAIKRVIDENPDLEGLALKKKIRADEDVIDFLEGDDLYDNQLNRFISLYKGERTLAQRGRKGAERVETLGNRIDRMSPEDQAKIESFLSTLGGEDQLNEMAKISGKLESAIKKVINDNSDLEGLALKKKIKADADVVDALAGDDLYDNQLNKFIALTRGERTLAQRGRKPSETSTPRPSTPTSSKPAPKPEDKAEEKAKSGAGDKFAAKGDKYGDLKKELAGVISDMKDIAAEYRKAEGKKKEELTKKLKSLSASKATLEKEMQALKKI